MEQILVVKTEILEPFLSREGIIAGDTGEIIDTILSRHEFIARDGAETDRGYKQIIPYVVIRRGGSVFLLRRLNKTTEKRLHGLMSLGIGGHINPDFEQKGNPIEAGLFRELSEEVSVPDIGRLEFRGVINDHSSEVSFYHTGLVYVLETCGEVSVLETDKMEGHWVEITALPDLKREMEAWSQVIVDSNVLE